MTSFVNANFGSDSDTDDDDFVPDASTNPDDNDDKGKAKKRGNSPKARKSRKVGGIRLEGEEEEDPNDEDEEQRRKEFEEEKEALKEAQETKKIDDLWSDFKKDTSESSKKIQFAPKPTCLGTLGSTSKPKPITKPAAVKKKSSESIMSSIFDAFEKKEKGLADNALVETEKEIPKEGPKQETSPSLFSSIFEKYEKKSDKDKKEEVKGFEKSDSSKIKITKIFDFAGDSVEVSKEVAFNSKEAKKFLKEKEEKEKTQELSHKRPAAAAAGGLNRLVSTITNKKPKMGCLDKSKIDWDAYVKDEGIKEELETFNKGKDGFVEKQMFLERADLRRFEQEKAAREKTRKPLNR